MKWRSKAFLAFVLLAVVYISIHFFAAPPRTTLARYDLTPEAMRLVNIAVVVPVLTVWFLALYGYQKVREYSSQLDAKSRDSAQVAELTKGVMFLAYWLPVTSTLSAVLQWQARYHPDLGSFSTILTNYMSVIFPLIGLFFIARAARGLGDLSKHRLAQGGIYAMAVILISAGVIYGYLVSEARGSIGDIYHLPMPLVLTTLVIPYIFTWFLGLLSAFYIHTYSREVPGVIYRKSWNTFAFGIVWIILFLIAFQYLATVSAKLSDLSLPIVLLLLYGALVLMGLGFAFLARGASQLKKIEEV